MNEAAECCPSRSVPGDQLGMLNHTTDATRAAALRRVRYGRLYDLGRVLGENLPAFPGRYFRQTLVTTPTKRCAHAFASPGRALIGGHGGTVPGPGGESASRVPRIALPVAMR